MGEMTHGIAVLIFMSLAWIADPRVVWERVDIRDVRDRVAVQHRRGLKWPPQDPALTASGWRPDGWTTKAEALGALFAPALGAVWLSGWAARQGPPLWLGLAWAAIAVVRAIVTWFDVHEDGGLVRPRNGVERLLLASVLISAGGLLAVSLWAVLLSLT